MRNQERKQFHLQLKVHCESLTISELKTLVYCDLEATGLKSSGRPRISELSLVAVNIEDVLELNSQLKIQFHKCPHKMSVCFQEL